MADLDDRVANPMADDPRAFWNETAGPKWVQSQARLDRMLQAITERLLAATEARPGERIIDVGCGCGATALALGERVGPTGTVLGVDISEPMVQHARSCLPADARHIEFVLDDATTHAFEPGQSQLITSRLGVMFFPRPVLAFANLRRALTEDGRLVFLCWRDAAENSWLRLAMQAFPQMQAPPYPDPGLPGPFSLAAPDRVRQILGEAGYRDVKLEPVTETVYLGETAEDVAYIYTQIGPLSRLLREVDDAQRQTMLEQLPTFFAGQVGEGGFELPSASWIVRARGQVHGSQ